MFQRVALSSWRYFTKKWMVSSTDIPKATLNTKMVEGFMAMPKKPIMPAVRMSGITLGSNEIRIMRNERNIYAINNAINKMASPKETTKLRTKKRVPLR